MFRNKRGDRLKILAWQGDGFTLYVRRLEKGTFRFPAADAVEVAVTATELAMILGGIELGSAKRSARRFVLPGAVHGTTAAVSRRRADGAPGRRGLAWW